jgi:uncharacterized membrane protein YjjP (DUF1212 family)
MTGTRYAPGVRFLLVVIVLYALLHIGFTVLTGEWIYLVIATNALLVVIGLTTYIRRVG